MVEMADAIRVARKVVAADAKAKEMADYRHHPDFAELREAAYDAREFLRAAGVHC